MNYTISWTTYDKNVPLLSCFYVRVLAQCTYMKSGSDFSCLFKVIVTRKFIQSVKGRVKIFSFA
jgi:hypothetical protein